MPANGLKHKENRTCTSVDLAILGNDLHSSFRGPAQGRRHRRTGAVLERDRTKSMTSIKPPEPGDCVAAERSAAVPDQPIGLRHGEYPPSPFEHRGVLIVRTPGLLDPQLFQR